MKEMRNKKRYERERVAERGEREHTLYKAKSLFEV